MKPSQPNHQGNVVAFRPAEDAQSDNILRMLDLSKFEHNRRAVESGAGMRANIAAMVLLGLLVFIATEDFSKLEQSNLRLDKSEYRN